MQTKIEFETIGNRLDAMRKVVNMTKLQAYEFLNTTEFIYKKVRFGEKKMPIDWAYKFRDTYNFRLDWIYSGTGEIFNKD